MTHSPAGPPDLPPAEAAYLGTLVEVLRHELGEQLVGVYLFGSAAAGAYEPGISDLDVQAVVAGPPPADLLRTIAARLAHRALPCPARRLEFVIYTTGAIDPPARHPRFALNWNTGAGEADHLSLDPAGEAFHWFLLDIALGRAVGRSLHGPPPAELFAPIPRRWVLEAMRDSIDWHRGNEASSANAVLNAARCWRYALAGELGSKAAGAAWAAGQPEPPAVVAAATRLRHGGPPLDPAEVRGFIARVNAALDGALAGAQGA